MSSPRTAPDINRFPVALSAAEVRKAVGGKRKLRAVESVTVDIEGMSVEIQLQRVPGSLGGALTYLTCPRCGRPAERLRLVGDFGVSVACGSCLADVFGARYASQRRKGTGESLRRNGNA